MDITPIPGHEDYGATPDGRIWSRKRGPWREIKAFSDGKGGGYLKVKITNGKQFKVHVIVAACFIGPRPDGLTVNHIDGVKTNNAIANLEYCTPHENIRHAYRLGLMVPRRNDSIRGSQLKLLHNHVHGEEMSNHRLTEADVREIRAAHASGESTRAIGKRYGVSGQQVHRIVRRLKWKSVA